jgi:hypothetical protein
MYRDSVIILYYDQQLLVIQYTNSCIWNTCDGNTVYQQLHLKYLCNMGKYWLQTP